MSQILQVQINEEHEAIIKSICNGDENNNQISSYKNQGNLINIQQQLGYQKPINEQNFQEKSIANQQNLFLDDNNKNIYNEFLDLLGYDNPNIDYNKFNNIESLIKVLYEHGKIYLKQIYGNEMKKEVLPEKLANILLEHFIVYYNNIFANNKIDIKSFKKNNLIYYYL